jgi:transcriptional regulator with XRE-family HTH domain
VNDFIENAMIDKKSITEAADDKSPNPVDKHVGAQLRLWRGVKGLTQDDLASVTGITFQQIQKYEAGKNRISASRLYQFAQILGTPVAVFFESFNANEMGQANPHYGLSDNEQDGFENPIAIQSDMLNSKESIEVLRTYYAIKDEKLRKDFLKMMKQMAKNFEE